MRTEHVDQTDPKRTWQGLGRLMALCYSYSESPPIPCGPRRPWAIRPHSQIKKP
jgi:hypothetical protein